MVDEGPLLGQVAQHPAGRAGDLPDRGHRARHEDQEHPAIHPVGGQVLLGDLVLAFPALAVDHRDAVRGGRRADPAGESPGHPHQVRIVQLLIVTMQASPPGAEPARVVTQRVVGVEHDPVHAVVAAVEQIAVALAEPVGHLGRFPSAAPPGAIRSGQRPGTELAGLKRRSRHDRVKFALARRDWRAYGAWCSLHSATTAHLTCRYALRVMVNIPRRSEWWRSATLTAGPCVSLLEIRKPTTACLVGHRAQPG